MPELLTTEPFHVDWLELDGGELPEGLISQVALGVVRLLVRNGIDPSDVYFRGRRGVSPEALGDDNDYLTADQQRLDRARQASVGWHGVGEDDDYLTTLEAEDLPSVIWGEVERRKIRNEEALGRQIDGSPNPAYTMSLLDNLLDSGKDFHPVREAGVTDESYIDVFDRTMIDALNQTLRTGPQITA